MDINFIFIFILIKNLCTNKVSYLQHFPRDESLAISTPNSIQPLIVSLAVRDSVSSHIFPLEDRPAFPAGEAPSVPLPVQGHQCLTLRELLTAAGTFWQSYDISKLVTNQFEGMEEANLNIPVKVEVFCTKQK